MVLAMIRPHIGTTPYAVLVELLVSLTLKPTLGGTEHQSAERLYCTRGFGLHLFRHRKGREREGGRERESQRERERERASERENAKP